MPPRTVNIESVEASPREYSSASSTSGLDGIYEWQCRLLSPSDALDAVLVQQVYDVFRGAFGFEPSQGLDSIRYRLRNSNVLGLLRHQSGDARGFVFYSVPSVPLGGTYFLWGDGMALMPEVQGKGLTHGFIDRVCSLFPGRLFRQQRHHYRSRDSFR